MGMLLQKSVMICLAKIPACDGQTFCDGIVRAKHSIAQ